MRTALICSPHQLIRDRLSEQLAKVDYTVDGVATSKAIFDVLKYQKRDVVIIESEKDNFSAVLIEIFKLNPKSIIHFFFEERIFCFYPCRSQPLSLIKAMTQAGLKISPRLLNHTLRRAEAHPESQALMI